MSVRHRGPTSRTFVCTFRLRVLHNNTTLECARADDETRVSKRRRRHVSLSAYETEETRVAKRRRRHVLETRVDKRRRLRDGGAPYVSPVPTLKHTVIQHIGRMATKRNSLNRSLPPSPPSSPAASIARDIEEFTLRVAARQGASYVEARLQGVASIVIVNPA